MDFTASEAYIQQWKAHANIFVSEHENANGREKTQNEGALLIFMTQVVTGLFA